ncbi:serine/threonine-protein kinase OXI1-like [Pyrus ussuriensis x Pyrus communis]|uniref:Serine/threonine-protein kinase OXI1-like n=1 Tax=Pyrus ussuriensis x Pyrus communis TaxID=2448454 RepID=A0A5N5FHN1_9ROSA|nr:serine/threonine-protein kinase OXI1-like [Pyrus ussuriensis x Pyrus communis]
MGTIFLVHDPSSDPSTRCPFALKVVDKFAFRFKLEAERHARWEIQVLTRLSSLNPYPFLPSIMGSFESDEFMGWAIPYCPVFEVSRAASAP